MTDQPTSGMPDEIWAWPHNEKVKLNFWTACHLEDEGRIENGTRYIRADLDTVEDSTTSSAIPVAELAEFSPEAQESIKRGLTQEGKTKYTDDIPAALREAEATVIAEPLPPCWCGAEAEVGVFFGYGVEYGVWCSANKHHGRTLGQLEATAAINWRKLRGERWVTVTKAGRCSDCDTYIGSGQVNLGMHYCSECGGRIKRGEG